MTGHRGRQILLIAVAAIVLGVASTAAFAVARLDKPSRPYAGGSYANAPVSCDVPALPGTVVNVTLTDIAGAMMGPGGMGLGMMGPGWNGSYGPGMMSPGMMGPGWNGQNATGAPAQGRPGMRMMSILVDPTTVPAGEVSFRVANTGAWIHEMTVLPLGAGQNIGQRSLQADNKVDESSALAHAGRTCDTGDGDGIVTGGISWATATLDPGRYELICNLAGHYWAGMYTELEVTSNR